MHNSYKWEILADHSTVKLDVQTAACNKSFQCLVFVLTQLHFRQWSSLPCNLSRGLPEFVHFSLLCMIVKMAYNNIHSNIIVGNNHLGQKTFLYIVNFQLSLKTCFLMNKCFLWMKLYCIACDKKSCKLIKITEINRLIWLLVWNKCTVVFKSFQ